ncbi:MAG TPA: SIMPL domain-containing protein [Candidatus Eisenbacteria bacterium]|nr:SIMPL domain-containing protein [Candidatus Eisenbacteria bacterium]
MKVKQLLLTPLLSSVFTLVLLLLVNYFLNHSWNLFAGSSNAQPFTVTGTASISQKPDSATISFGVTKSASTLADAQNQANTSTNKIVADLKKLGIDEKDIKTSNYNSYPVYDSNTKLTPRIAQPIGGGTSVNGYTVSENVEVTLKDITKANTVIDAVTKDGAENISGPNLTFSQATQDSLTQKARLEAIKDAKSKAESLASAAGIRLGRITNIQEGSEPFPIRPVMMLKAADSGSAGLPTQIQPGENTITSTVTLSYQTW